MIEKTLILLKPDAVRRNLIGEIISRFERKGLKIVAMKFMKLDEEKAKEHYKVHLGKDFYEPLIKFITSGPIVAMIIQGEQAIEISRIIVGKTSPHDATPGSIRGDFASITRENLVHASDSPESAEREMAIFFDSSDIISW